MNDGNEPEIKAPDSVDPLAAMAPAEDGRSSEAPIEAVDEAAQAAAAAVSTGLATETVDAFEAARVRLQAMSDIAFGRNGSALVGLPNSQVGLSGPETMASYKAATVAMTELNSKIVDVWRANTENAFAHWNKLRHVTTWAEAIQLNAEHTRLQMETMSTQTRELSTLAGQIARTSMDGFKKAGR